jgi:HlyD family secretion protein
MNLDPAPAGQTRTPFRTMVVWGVMLAVVVAALSIVSVMKKAREKNMQVGKLITAPPVVTVSVSVPHSSEVQDLLTATGTVAAVNPMSVGPEIGGLRIESIDTEEGRRVSKGQVLATLNRATLEAQMAQAQARYQGSVAQQSKAVQPNRPQDILSLRAALSQAQANEAQEGANVRQSQANLAYARQTAQRYTEVRDEGFVTAQEAQDHSIDVARARDSLDAARHRLSAARYSTEQSAQRLALALAGGRREDVQNAEANTGEMRANIQLLQAQLDQTVIRAPDAGLVTQRDAHIGDIVSPTKTLFNIARKGELEIKAQVPEADLQKIKIGDVASVKIGQTRLSGKVWTVSPSVDSSTRLGTARILLELGGSHRRVLPGMFASVSMNLGHHLALLVPSGAVLGESDDHYSFVLGTGYKVRRVKVEVGARTDDSVEIRSGIRAEDQVVVKGAGFLSDGDAVSLDAGKTDR